eukprot:scaffold4335_cov220-Pinguiococcus_pyrenoidosus.AAC.3
MAAWHPAAGLRSRGAAPRLWRFLEEQDCGQDPRSRKSSAAHGAARAFPARQCALLGHSRRSPTALEIACSPRLRPSRCPADRRRVVDQEEANRGTPPSLADPPST